jgi:hypothetical protein
MDQRSICLYLRRKGLSDQAIHNELVKVLGSDAAAYSTMTLYLRACHWRALNEEERSDLPPDVIASAILQALKSSPIRVNARTRKVHLYSNHNSFATLDWLLRICCQVFALGSPPLDRGPKGKFESIAQKN